MSYSPTLGRFLETDPMGYIDGPNLYQMEQSNPVNHVDPFGLAALPPGHQGPRPVEPVPNPTPKPPTTQPPPATQPPTTRESIRVRLVWEIYPARREQLKNNNGFLQVPCGGRVLLRPWLLEVDDRGQPILVDGKPKGVEGMKLGANSADPEIAAIYWDVRKDKTGRVVYTGDTTEREGFGILEIRGITPGRTTITVFLDMAPQARTSMKIEVTPVPATDPTTRP